MNVERRRHHERLPRPVRGALRGLLAAAACVALTAGCDDRAELTGSLKDAYGISHRFVRVRLTTAELAIEYVGARGSVPVRATIDLRTVDGLLTDGRYDLPAQGWIGGRLVNETELPPLISGSITLDRFVAEDGATVRGDFDGRFDAGRDELAIGGAFEEPLELLLDLGDPAPVPEWVDGGVPEGGVPDGGAGEDGGP